MNSQDLEALKASCAAFDGPSETDTFPATVVSQLLSHITALEAEKAEARNTATLLRAEADGLGSMLLDVQQDCITAVQRAETAEAKEYAMSFEYFAAIGKALLDGAMDDCFAAYQVDVAELREGKKTWTGEQTAHVIDRMLAVMIGMNNRLDIVQAEARRLALDEALGKVAEEIAACEDERNLRPLNSYHWAFWDRARRTASDIEAAILALKERT